MKEKRARDRAVLEEADRLADEMNALERAPVRRMDSATARALVTVLGAAAFVIIVGIIALVGETYDANARRACVATSGVIAEVHGGGGWVCLGETP